MTEQPGCRQGHSRVVLFGNGASTHTVRWANALVGRSVETHVVTLEPCLPSLDARITVHKGPIEGPLGYVLSTPWARKLLRTIKPDLLHAHYASGYGTLARLTGFHPSIVSVWGSDVFRFPKRGPLNKQLIRGNLSYADCILSTSHAMANHTRQFTKKAIKVTPFGVDIERFAPEEPRHRNPQEVVIGTVKALEEIYGLEYLLKAFRLVKERAPGVALKLLIIGGGSLRENLCSLARDLGISEQTRFVGRIDHDEVPRYLNMLDVYVAPSLCESFGVAVVEASACGRPVVVSNVGGLPEVVDDGVSGFVVEPKREDELAKAIARLVVDPSLRSRMGNAGREKVRRSFDWSVNVSQMLSIYTELIQENGREQRCA